MYPTLRPLSPSELNPNTTKKEKAYGDYLKTKASDAWRTQILANTPYTPAQHRQKTLDSPPLFT